MIKVILESYVFHSKLIWYRYIWNLVYCLVLMRKNGWQSSFIFTIFVIIKKPFHSILIAHIFLSVKPNQTCADLPYLAERHIEKYFICPEGRCLPASGPENATCNYFYDCLNGEDEEGCSKSEKRLNHKSKCRSIVQMKKFFYFMIVIGTMN